MTNQRTINFAIERQVESSLLDDFVDAHEIQHHDDFDLKLTSTVHGLQLQASAFSKKPLNYFIDIDAFCAQQTTFPAAKQAGFNQALGKQNNTIIDLTAGWGGDSMLMCAQGYAIKMVERHPVMALMLKDAMRRLAQTPWAQRHDIVVPQVYEANAKTLLLENQFEADCLYFDPMFPPKRKKSAAANKNMQLLHWLVGDDADAAEVLQVALQQQHIKRIAVKRPHYATPLLDDAPEALQRRPDVQFTSKLVHYDVYLLN